MSASAPETGIEHEHEHEGSSTVGGGRAAVKKPVMEVAGSQEMRMAELAARSGVSRETIHFYLREGLLPRPRKGGRTVAYYGAEHLERLLLIRRLREEKYLPIAVIRRLLASPAAAAERDVDALADVLHIVPPDDDGGPPAAPAALREAEVRGLLGPSRAGEGTDPVERRVLEAVEDALALDDDARRLTLDDLEACAAGLTSLVSREAELFFDMLFQLGDVSRSIAALRGGRATVARFIAAYRDLMLRRVVEELLVGLERGPESVVRAATVPLSPACEAALGVPARREALHEAWRRDRSEAAAARLVWHLFGSGAAGEIAALPADLVASLGARLRPLCAWGVHESARSAEALRAFDQAVKGAPDLVLGRVLLGEAIVARGVRRRGAGAGVLEEAVPALHAILGADPDQDPEPLARAFGWFHRGRLELALPAVLGRKARGAAALERAIRLIEAEKASIEPIARARIEANAKLALARHLAGAGDALRARSLFAEAAAIDPEGPIALVAREEA